MAEAHAKGVAMPPNTGDDPPPGVRLPLDPPEFCLVSAARLEVAEKDETRSSDNESMARNCRMRRSSTSAPGFTTLWPSPVDSRCIVSQKAISARLLAIVRVCQRSVRSFAGRDWVKPGRITTSATAWTSGDTRGGTISGSCRRQTKDLKGPAESKRQPERTCRQMNH